MISEDPYDVWRRQRSQVPIDDQFVDRVMERIYEDDPSRHHRLEAVAQRSWRRFARYFETAAAVFIVGLCVGLVRASSLIIFLLLSTSTGG